MTSLIEVDELHKTFRSEDRTVEAVEGVSFEVKEGSFVSIVGPSGCGKSTILKIIAGFISPSSGEVRFDGRPIKEPGAERAVVFQEDAVFPWMSVQDNLEYGPRRRKVSEERRNELVDHYIELVGLEDYRDLYPKELSGGMKKRVDIARAYANEPKILLMDEPFGSLDVLTKCDMQDELLEILRVESKSVIFVTHDLEEAIFMSDKVIFLTERPAKIKKVMEIPFERPRKQNLKTKNEFQGFRQEASEQLGIFS